MDSVANSIAKFSVRFVNELDKGSNVVASPLSCEILLALLTLGSTDPTHQELTNALGIATDEDVKKAFKSVSSKLKTIKGVTLDVANKIYIKDGNYELHPGLSKDSVDVFDAALEKVDFNQGAAAAKTINNWVEEKTRQKIKDLISADSLSSETRLVLVNAIYFKGSWKIKFQERNTKDRDFFVTATTKIQVPMMHNEDNFRYGFVSSLNAEILEMPYEGFDASMVIVLPKEVEGLNDVMQKLAAGHDLMANIREDLRSQKVKVQIPKFKIETTIDLIPVLSKLGIKSMFEPRENGLTKILNSPEGLYVSQAVQKAFIEVNEEGTEAAAATAQTVRVRRSAPLPPREFVADRPALYCVLAGGAITFMARHRPPVHPRDEL